MAMLAGTRFDSFPHARGFSSARAAACDGSTYTAGVEHPATRANTRVIRP